MIASADLLVEPAWRSGPTYVKTYGDEVSDLAAMVDFTPDPEQRLGLDLLFAVDAAGQSAVFEFGVICSRQNLKTGLFKQAALGWLFITDQNLIVWSAHEFRTAQEAFRDMEELIGGHPSLSRLIKKVHRAAGSEGIELKTGQRLMFKARTHAGGRGLTGDRIVLDEAFALKPEHMGALLPTLSVVPDPQVVYGSSAGLAQSEVLRGIRDRGRPGTSPRLAYLEWGNDRGGCADDGCSHVVGTEGCALDDMDRVGRANPLLGRTRANGTGLTLEYIRAERQALPPEEFARERLGWWDDPLLDQLPINPAEWAVLAKPHILQRRPADMVPTFFVHVAPGSTHSAITVAYPVDERPFIELADYRPGTSWLPARCAELDSKHPGGVWKIEAAGAAGAELPALKDEGIIPEEFTAREMGQACAHLQQLVKDKGMWHSGDAAFSIAVQGAVARPVGEGLWVFSSRKSSVDVTPITGAAGALWALESDPGLPQVF